MNAFLQADGSVRDISSLASAEWDPSNVQRIRKLHAPADFLNDAPVARHRSSRKYLLSCGLGFRVSSFDPCSYFVFRKEG